MGPFMTAQLQGRAKNSYYLAPTRLVLKQKKQNFLPYAYAHCGLWSLWSQSGPQGHLLPVCPGFLYLLQGAEYPLLMMSCRMAVPSITVAAHQSLLLTSTYQVTFKMLNVNIWAEPSSGSEGTGGKRETYCPFQSLGPFWL